MDPASTDTDTEQFYDQIWKQSWLVLHEIGPMTRARYRLIVGLLNGRLHPGQKLLDAGCGSGGLLTWIGRAFPSLRLFASEYSSEALRALPPALCEQVFPGSLEDPSLLAGQCFDVIVCSEVLEHLDHPDRALSVLTHSLVSGGLMLITVPHRKDYWGPQDEFAGHRRRFEQEELIALTQSAGLTLLTCTVWGFPFSYLYLKILSRHRPDALAARASGRLAQFASDCLYQLFKLDDGFRTRRGFQLLLLAEKPRNRLTS